ncbi:hypothetical protein ES332_A12G102100v1 [Gossypium tomentosum]|uniref:Uncharacterized protein n=1 Tax=Gossypium tomentosum TaxID=34277 RepID=A0A5D2MY60_GOSTO|nr:hypothetical protein ES332_A12G102100v1 [Gossypium tomentosum]
MPPIKPSPLAAHSSFIDGEFLNIFSSLKNSFHCCHKESLSPISSSQCKCLLLSFFLLFIYQNIFGILVVVAKKIGADLNASNQ